MQNKSKRTRILAFFLAFLMVSSATFGLLEFGAYASDSPYGTLGLPNLARGTGRSYLASTQWNADFGADRAFTGQTTDLPRWAPTDNPAWIQVNFGEPTDFNVIRIYEGEGPHRTVHTVDVDISNDGSNWTHIRTFALAPVTQSVDFRDLDLILPVTANSVRLRLAASGNINVRELEIYNVPDVELSSVNIVNGSISAVLAAEPSVATPVTEGDFRIQYRVGSGEFQDLAVYNFSYTADAIRTASFDFEPFTGVSVETVTVRVQYRGSAAMEGSFETAGLINLARGAGRTYLSDSQYNNDFRAEQAFTGTTGDIPRWAASSNPAWIQVNFGEPVAFNLLRVYEGEGNNRSVHTFEVMVSNDGSDWTSVRTFEFDPAGQIVDYRELDLILPITASFMRLGLAANGSINIRELEIYNMPLDGLYVVDVENGHLDVIFTADVGIITADKFAVQINTGSGFSSLPVFNFAYNGTTRTASFRFNPISPRFDAIDAVIRVSFDGLGVVYGQFTVGGLINLARGPGRTYTASSEDTRWGDMGPHQAFNGDQSGANNARWASNDGTPQWLQVTFEEAISFNMVRVHRPSGSDMDRVRAITIQTSDDGILWTAAGTVSFPSPAPVVMDVVLPYLNSNFVRVVFAGAGNGMNINEVEIFNVPFLTGFNVIEDFERFADGTAMPGSALLPGQSRVVESAGALSGNRSLRLSSSGAGVIDVNINELIGMYNVMVQLKSISGGLLSISDIDGAQFARVDAYGYDRALQHFITIQWDYATERFVIPTGFDGYIFFTNTENLFLENLRLSIQSYTENTVWIDNIAACDSDDYLQLLLWFESIRVNIEAVNITSSSITISWEPVEGATGYHVFRADGRSTTLIRRTDQPITETFHTSTDLQPLTYATFRVTAIVQGQEIDISNNAYFHTENIDLDGELLSSRGRTLLLPFSDFALNMEYLGPVLSSTEWFYWCLDPIEDEDGNIQLFVVRWPSHFGMNGWLTHGEIVRAVSTTGRPEGPFEVVQRVLGNAEPNPCSDFPPPDHLLPEGQRSAHNVRINKIDGKYVLLYIVQTGNQGQIGQTICMMTAESIEGPWTFAGENGDGIVVQVAPEGSGHWTRGGTDGTTTIVPVLGVDNCDIIKIDGRYFIYFKAGGVGYSNQVHNIFGFPSRSLAFYGYAVSDYLTHGFVKSDAPITNNFSYIEDATVFEMNGKIYLLTCDNFGGDTTGVVGGNPAGYGLLWVSHDRGRTFDVADAQIFFGLMQDYIAIPPFAAEVYGGTGKFERPAVLVQNGVPTYFFGTNGTNIFGVNTTQNFVFRLNVERPPCQCARQCCEWPECDLGTIICADPGCRICTTPTAVVFSGSNPNALRVLLEQQDVVLQAAGNLGIFTHHSPFVIPEGRTLTVVSTLNVQGNAELHIYGTLVVQDGGRVNNQGGAGGTIVVKNGGELRNNGHVENVTNSAFINYGTIVNNARFEIRASTSFHNCGTVVGNLNIHRTANIIICDYC